MKVRIVEQSLNVSIMNSLTTIQVQVEVVFGYSVDNLEVDTMPVLPAAYAHPETKTTLVWLCICVPHLLASSLLAKQGLPVLYYSVQVYLQILERYLAALVLVFPVHSLQ